MNSLQTLSDKTAIGLSLLCTAHCLLFPTMMVLLPNLAALNLDSEAFHVWMLVAVVPTSAYALLLGCNKHKHVHLLLIGLVGLACLILAIALEGLLHDSSYGEFIEKGLTTLGAAILVYAHFNNYRLCQKNQDCCDCSQHESDINQTT